MLLGVAVLGPLGRAGLGIEEEDTGAIFWRDASEHRYHSTYGNSLILPVW